MDELGNCIGSGSSAGCRASGRVANHWSDSDFDFVGVGFAPRRRGMGCNQSHLDLRKSFTPVRGLSLALWFGEPSYGESESHPDAGMAAAGGGASRRGFKDCKQVDCRCSLAVEQSSLFVAGMDANCDRGEIFEGDERHYTDEYATNCSGAAGNPCRLLHCDFVGDDIDHGQRSGADWRGGRDYREHWHLGGVWLVVQPKSGPVARQTVGMKRGARLRHLGGWAITQCFETGLDFGTPLPMGVG